MDQETITEWFDNPVTLYFLKLIKDRHAEINEAPRYRAFITGGDSQTPVTADFSAMQQAHLQGQLDILDDITNLKEMMLNED